MKSRETLIRLKKFQVDEKRRKVAQIEAMIAEFDRIAAELEREIKTRAGPRRHPRPRPFRLSDLCQGRHEPAREPQALGRRAQGPARRRQGHAGRGLRGIEEGRDARRARPRAREGGSRTPASRPSSTASPACVSPPTARTRSGNLPRYCLRPGFDAGPLRLGATKYGTLRCSARIEDAREGRGAQNLPDRGRRPARARRRADAGGLAQGALGRPVRRQRRREETGRGGACNRRLAGQRLRAVPGLQPFQRRRAPAHHDRAVADAARERRPAPHQGHLHPRQERAGDGDGRRAARHERA